MKKEIIGKYVAILGLLLFGAPLWGIADSYFTMASSFQEITLFGTNDPKIAPEEMTSAAMFTAIGALLSMVGLILLAIAVVGLNYRKSWFFLGANNIFNSIAHYNSNRYFVWVNGVDSASFK